MKVVTGSHSGSGTWLVQRATAAVLALVLPGLVVYVLAAMPADFERWRALFLPLWLRLLLWLTAVALALHAWVGMRDILMDYVHATGLRLALHLVVIVILSASIAWLAGVLWSVA